MPTSLYITLGLHMDGAPYPLAPGHGKSGRCYGPNGFLGQLEAWLGLPPFEDIAQSHGQRVALCMRAAGELCKPRRGRWEAPFYKESFDKAKWSTAKRLLFMLDFLLMAGWHAGANADPESLPNLAAMEQIFTELNKYGEFQSPALRFERLLGCLQQKYPLPRITIKLLEEEVLWPYYWRELFKALRKAMGYEPPQANKKNDKNTAKSKNTKQNAKKDLHDPIDTFKTPTQSASSDLGHLQHCLNLLFGEFSKPKEDKLSQKAFTGDGSLCLFECETSDQAAETVALMLQSCKSAAGKVTLLHTSEGHGLNRALQLHHLPVVGETSVASNDILQLLPTALRLHWAPRSMQTLMDFLLLRGCPVPYNVRQNLIRALNSRPGIGSTAWMGNQLQNDNIEGDSWTRAVFYSQKELLQNESDLDYGDEDTADSKKNAQQRWEEICQWARLPQNPVFDENIFDENKGIPTEMVMDICDKLALIARRKGHSQYYRGIPGAAAAFAVLRQQCLELKERLECMGEDLLPRPLLEDLLQDLPSGTTITAPQAAWWRTATHPGQICHEHDTLVWWLFEQTSTSRSGQRFFTEKELAWLEKHKYHLPDPASQEKIDLVTFVRNIALTRQRCLFVLPKYHLGEATLASPWLDIVKSCFTPGSVDNLIISDSEALTDQIRTEQARQIIVPTPPENGEWHFPGCSLKKALGKLNASSLEGYTACPFATLVKTINIPYDADHPERVLSFAPADRRRISNPPLWLGNFAHFLLQELVRPRNIRKLTPDNAAKLMEELINEKNIAQYAAPLLQAESAYERKTFTSNMTQAAVSIATKIKEFRLKNPRIELGNHGVLKQKNIDGIVTKQVLIRKLDNIPLEGRADIIWQMPGMKQVVWDLKYSDGTRYYHEDMKENTGKAWQLTAYQKIFPETSGVAFWLIKNDRFLGTENSGVSSDAVVANYNLDASWNNLVEALVEMNEQWKNGTIKVAQYDDNDCKFCCLSFVCGGGYAH